MLLQPRTRLLFVGDSITDCNRRRPVGEGRFDALGNGYVAQVDALLGVAYPQRPIQVINQGISGNTVLDLAARWQPDVIAQKPDYLVVMIGINDVWRQVESRAKPGVPPDLFNATLRQLTEPVRHRVRQLILMTPFVIESNRADAMRAMMDRYGLMVTQLAAEYGVPVVNTQAAFDQLLEHMPSSALAEDRVHPNQVGHMAIARAFLQAIGYHWQGEAPR